MADASPALSWSDDLDTMMMHTKNTLGSLISKPPMRDKLLGRPPLRFLHDCVTAVTEATGFLDGVFVGPELEPKEMDRDAKIAFIAKLVAELEARLGGVSLAINPGEVVAGKNPQRTNLMLQVGHFINLIFVALAVCKPLPIPCRRGIRACCDLSNGRHPEFAVALPHDANWRIFLDIDKENAPIINGPQTH